MIYCKSIPKKALFLFHSSCINDTKYNWCNERVAQKFRYVSYHPNLDAFVLTLWILDKHVTFVSTLKRTSYLADNEAKLWKINIYTFEFDSGLEYHKGVADRLNSIHIRTLKLGSETDQLYTRIINFPAMSTESTSVT